MRFSPRSSLAPAAIALAILAPAAWAFTVTPSDVTQALGDEETAFDEICVDVEANAVVPKVDVYLLADTTGSMGSIINTLKAGATTVVGDLYDDLGADGSDVRIGVGNYKDFPRDVYAFRHQLDLVPQSDEAAVLAQINTWRASGGFDGSEGQLYALDRLANDVDPDGGDIGWRPDAKKIIVWFGDAPGHDAVCSEISGLADDITEASVTDALVDADITVIAISTTTGFPLGLDDDPTRSARDYVSLCGVPGGLTGQATRLTAATGGSYTTGVSASGIVTTILDTVADSAGTIASLGLDISDALLPYVTWFSPAKADIDTSVASQHCFDVNWEGVCGDEEQTVWGDISVVADGAVVGSSSVDLTLEACCPTDGGLGAAAPYNLFVMGWFSGTNSDVEGPVAIGGDAVFTGYGIGSKVSGGGTTLSVGGDLTVSNSQIYGGDGEAAGSCAVSSTGVPSGTLTCDHPGTFDAGDHMAEMVALSDHLADTPANGTVTTMSWGGVQLNGHDADLNVFDLDLNALGFDQWVWNGWINTFMVDVPAGSTVVINVLGDPEPLFRNGQYMGLVPEKTIWNVASQPTLRIENVSVPGSVLAPHSTVTFANGNIDGTLVAWDAIGTGEYHHHPFDGDVCP